MPLTAVTVLQLLLQYGPSAVAMAGKLYTDIQAGRGNTPLTAEDFAELQRLASQTGEDIYAKLGIVPPPVKPASAP